MKKITTIVLQNTTTSFQIVISQKEQGYITKQQVQYKQGYITKQQVHYKAGVHYKATGTIQAGVHYKRLKQRHLK